MIKNKNSKIIINDIQIKGNNKNIISIIYEKKISLMISLETNLENISSSKRHAKSFKRTLSRLYELTSPKDDFIT